MTRRVGLNSITKARSHTHTRQRDDDDECGELIRNVGENLFQCKPQESTAELAQHNAMVERALDTVPHIRRWKLHSTSMNKDFFLYYFSHGAERSNYAEKTAALSLRKRNNTTNGTAMKEERGGLDNER